MSYFLSDLHPTFNHLAQGESAFCRNGPRTFQADFVDSAQDPEKINRSLKRWQGEKKQNSPPGGLLDVHHVRDEGKALKFQPGNISLQQDVYLGGGLLHAFLDGDRYALQKLS